MKVIYLLEYRMANYLSSHLVIISDKINYSSVEPVGNTCRKKLMNELYFLHLVNLDALI